MKKKICTVCNVGYDLNHENFWKNKRKKDGFQSFCIPCGRKSNKEYDLKNKEENSRKFKEWVKRKVEEDPEYYKKKYEKDKENYRKRGNEYRQIPKNRITQIVNAAKFRSRNKNLNCDITTEFIKDLWEKQKGKCLLSGEYFDLKSGTRTEGFHFNPLAPCIDKIDSSKGYTKDNVRLICNFINIALGQYGTEFFDKMIKNYLKTTKNIEINYE